MSGAGKTPGTARIPNFLIVGAARCGTTSLVHSLRLHPRLFLPVGGAEPKFFSREAEYEKGTAYYLRRYFAGAAGFDAVGEKSTEYLENLSSAGRIQRFNPGMRILYLLREPLERTISNYWWSVHNGLEQRPLGEALRAEFERVLSQPARVSTLAAARPFAYIDRSLYCDNLQPYYDAFPREQIAGVLFEEFTTDRAAVLGRLFRFLGLSPLEIPAGKVAPQRAVVRGEGLDVGLARELQRFFRERNAGLEVLTGLEVSRFWG